MWLHLDPCVTIWYNLVHCTPVIIFIIFYSDNYLYVFRKVNLNSVLHILFYDKISYYFFICMNKHFLNISICFSRRYTMIPYKCMWISPFVSLFGRNYPGTLIVTAPISYFSLIMCDSTSVSVNTVVYDVLTFSIQYCCFLTSKQPWNFMVPLWFPLSIRRYCSDLFFCSLVR